MTARLKPLRLASLSAGSLALVLISGSALAQKKYDTGATDTEIKIGNTAPYSGSTSVYSVIAKTEQAYFNMINAEGGINGRKISFISYDDAFSPPKTVEQIRKLVEGDEVLLIFNSLGTQGNAAILNYLNNKGVPQLFIGSGASKFVDPEHFPWTMPFNPPLQAEGRIYAKYLLQNKPDAKVAVLYQNDDYGKDVRKGLVDGLGAKAASMIVAEDSYEISEPTIDSHIIKLKSTGADTLIDISTPKFGAQALKKIAELQWNVLHILNNAADSISSTIQPAGFENAQGILSLTYYMDPTDPQWVDNPSMKEWVAFMDKWNPGGDKKDRNNVYGVFLARTLVQVLKQCGDDITRANIMKQAASLKEFEPGLLLPGIKVNTSRTHWSPVTQNQMKRFEGQSWKMFGPVMDGLAE